jgi:drug/metabolite transporter (DMT)-like permease
VFALFLGSWFLNEPLNALILPAIGIILAGVVITTLPKMAWER